MVSGKLITRNSGVAIWRQIADQIRGDITAGKMASGARLPPEVEMATRFAVNRHTIRSAIAALTKEGVLRAEQGRGTFVANSKKLTYRIGERTRFSQILAAQVRETKGILLAHRLEDATPEVAEALEMRFGQVIRIDTVHTADGNPVSCATSWFDAARVPSIVEDYRSSGSITFALKAAGIDDYLRKSTVIAARHADAEDLRHLCLSPGAIVLVATAINVDMDGRPVEYGKTRFAADRMEIAIDNRSIG
ncbi:phosphonate metabolism transcriptional regulator PhnF [Phyllobacterium brassicacearum]|uniref:Phosphonate metabolism transcriptional regulator PhnF n=1 Tax=Phyllobacterium brassicacearum TaxID=314235 RepID=A0A2P7BTI6_9HYPH|nr:phosphonate metabolism transcriptional regulator PhnF [Phyllobacterium brassicacearum]PSH69784.1 phosphonate metabolism transcriptional regulator PhnF [Phyllobacterium brassicacearum]TDQ34938.1 GntR family transcriptional regulator [Phyllobacterium brassicacearum]